MPATFTADIAQTSRQDHVRPQDVAWLLQEADIDATVAFAVLDFADYPTLATVAADDAEAALAAIRSADYAVVEAQVHADERVTYTVMARFTHSA